MSQHPHELDRHQLDPRRPDPHQPDPGGSTPAVADVVVVGAGLAGLVAAATAARGGASVHLLDAARPGGRARSTTVGSGAVLNAGPRALYRDGAAARELARLGIRWTGATPVMRGAAARRGGVNHAMPAGAWTLLRTGLVGGRGTLQLGSLLAALPRTDVDRVRGRSVSEWVAAGGFEPAAAEFVQAMVRLATYVDDPDHLDAAAALAQLRLAVGSGVEYLDGGWQQLVDGLVAQADGCGARISTGRRVLGISRADGGDVSGAVWSVETSEGPLRARSVVLATGTPAAAARLAPGALSVAGVSPPVTAACLELVVRGPVTTPFLLGVDRPLYLSQHGPPARLAPDGLAVVHVLRYGATDDAASDLAEMTAHAAAAGIRPEHAVERRVLRRMVVMGGAPTATAGGLTGRPPVQPDPELPLFLAGDWVGDEGLLADAAASSGAAAARAALDDLARRHDRMVV